MIQQSKVVWTKLLRCTSVLMAPKKPKYHPNWVAARLINLVEARDQRSDQIIALHVSIGCCFWGVHSWLQQSQASMHLQICMPNVGTTS